jgi:murein L,D-transpeptidase YcbB/YkuD
MLAGAACAALMIPAMSAQAANSPSSSTLVTSSEPSLAAFYAGRHGAPLWLSQGADGSAARELISVLRRASLDGLDSGPALAAQAQSLIQRGQAGDPAALGAADQLLSAAWVKYVQALQTPPAGMVYADSWVTPRRDSAAQILARASTASSLAAHVRSVSSVNPIYARLRETAWGEMQANGGRIDQRVLASLDRVRDMPFQKRYVMVDAASARLFMIEDGRVVDQMKVIVGKSSSQTPMLASTIYYATLNPYWHVSGDMIRSLIAPNVLQQGTPYLKSHGYQVMAADAPDGAEAQLLDPAKINWMAVANGEMQVKVRQLPGPANSMGRMKFGFPNAYDIYLHDTPSKELFASGDRDLSHGCIRLEDAPRLARWMLQRDPESSTHNPEQNVALPTPVPIYVTYMTAHADGGQLSFADDPYGKDAGARGSIMALQ